MAAVMVFPGFDPELIRCPSTAGHMDAVKRPSTQPDTAAAHVGRYRRPAAEAAPVFEREKEKESDRKAVTDSSISQK